MRSMNRSPDKKPLQTPSEKQSEQPHTPPAESAPDQPRRWFKFQVSLKALIVIHMFIGCVVGIWVQNQTFGMVAAGTLIACLLVVYVEEEVLLTAILFIIMLVCALLLSEVD